MATKSIAWETGSGSITLTYSGSGNGNISVASDPNNLGIARSQVITVKAVNSSLQSTLTINQAACPFPVGDVKNFSYTGTYQEVTLPAGQYKLQCWGAQGGSNNAASAYGITAKTGGKGGYSEGIITLTQDTVVRIYVGGQGSSSAGGYNGGGNTTASSSYSSSNENGVSRMGGGGGATDIRLSDGGLLSRMIVAGGGAGGAMCYRALTTTTTTWTTTFSDIPNSNIKYVENRGYRHVYTGTVTSGKTYKLSVSGSVSPSQYSIVVSGSGHYYTWTTSEFTAEYTGTIFLFFSDGAHTDATLTIEEKSTSSSTSTSTSSQEGGVGGGTQGGGYSSSYVGKQNSAGTNGSFGQGASMYVSNWRYCSGAGGGGWYGGGSSHSDSSMTYCKYSGGGSGWVNIAANAANRPTGYTGLELDSGETKAGNVSFPNTAGTGNEIGHSGNGYAKITRLA